MNDTLTTGQHLSRAPLTFEAKKKKKRVVLYNLKSACSSEHVLFRSSCRLGKPQGQREPVQTQRIPVLPLPALFLLLYQQLPLFHGNRPPTFTLQLEGLTLLPPLPQSGHVTQAWPISVVCTLKMAIGSGIDLSSDRSQWDSIQRLL